MTIFFNNDVVRIGDLVSGSRGGRYFYINYRIYGDVPLNRVYLLPQSLVLTLEQCRFFPDSLITHDQV